MTLNDLERRTRPYFVFFSPNSIALLAKYVTVVEYRPIMSVNIVSHAVLVFHFWPKPAARLSAIAELLVVFSSRPNYIGIL